MNKFIFALVVAFYSTVASAQGLDQYSYGEAALNLVPKSHASMRSYLLALDESTLPHDVKVPIDIRKVVLKTRDFVDLFAYALPDAKINGKDGFRTLRNDLDKGYEILGSFKDQYDIQDVSDVNQARYNKKKLEKSRRAVLDWRDQFMARFEVYSSYLKAIETHELVPRARKDLSSFYWGASDETPKANEKATQSFRRLIAGLLTRAQQEWPEVRRIRNPAENVHDIEAFHDFRKRMRTVLKIVSYFPEVGPNLTDREISFLSDLSKQYGKISDQVAAMESALHDGSEDKAEQIIKDTADLWQKLQAWEDEQDIPAKIEQLQQILSSTR